MAGRRQTELDFRGAEVDGAAEFRAAMTLLREKLKQIPAERTGLSGLRWEQAIEAMMAIKSYQLAGRQPELADLLRTSRLTRNQWYVARDNAVALGLVESRRCYAAQARKADRLAINQASIDQLARGRPPTVATQSNADQVRLGQTKSDQVRPTQTSSKEVLARAAKELPNNFSSSSSSEGARAAVARVEEEVEEEKIVLLVGRCWEKFGDACPHAIDQAIRTAIKNGCTLEQLVDRCAWFYRHRTEWDFEHRAGALYRGLLEAQPYFPVGGGWPYRRRPL